MLGSVATLIVVILAVLVIVWIAIRLLSSAYIKTTPTLAFVRTGGLRARGSARPLVVVNGAAWVFGFLHRIKWVSLETMAIEVRHLDTNALISNDPQYVDLEARFFIKVADAPESISMAARTIGGDMVDEASLRRLAEPKINGAVRDVAATFSLNNLLEKRVDFIKQVQERLRDDLAENGLILESISLLTLRPTLQGRFSTDDILGAQVARANSAVIEQALTEKNRLENLGALERARQDAQAERERMGIEEEIEKERAQRAKNIALVQATEDTAAKVTQEAKREEAERARILTDRALQEATLENERVEALRREQLQQAVETEHVLREQAVAIAEQRRETQVAQATAEKLAATRLQIEADKAREQALQEALLLAERAAAERDAEIELINARLEAQKQSIESRNQVELEAMRLQEMAEAERRIAAAQAEAIQTRAAAELEVAKMAAIGERERTSAAGLAEVQVALERLKVLEREAETTRQKLIAEAEGDKARADALSSHDSIMRDMEMAHINADLLKAIEIARAEALGEAISGMKMNLFGDAAMARQLLQLVASAQSVQHIYDALPPVARNTLDGLAARLGTRTTAGDGHAGQPGISKLLDALADVVRERFPDALDDNPTLGHLADLILDSGDSSEDMRTMMHRLHDSPYLRDMPLQTALALARDWLKPEQSGD
jgi:uncharacterized membrane protein YqiK